MKANPTPETPALGFVQDNKQFSRPSAMGGTLRVQRQVTNFKSLSPTYQTMNETIVTLDSQFDTLPATGPDEAANQQAWSNAAGPYAGTEVCGCKGTRIDGKKLYRLTNFIRILQGSPQTAVAPAVAAPEEDHIEAVNVFVSEPPGHRDSIVNTSAGPSDFYVLFNKGLGMKTPLIKCKGDEGGTFFPEGTPEYEYLLSLGNNPKQPWCTFLLDGLPTGTGTVVCSLI